MRLKLSESPTFAAIQAEGSQSKAPYRESFGQWKNLKIVLTALVTMMCAQGAAWYTLFFYAEQVFLERFLKVAPATGTQLLIAITVASAPALHPVRLALRQGRPQMGDVVGDDAGADRSSSPASTP